MKTNFRLTIIFLFTFTITYSQVWQDAGTGNPLESESSTPLIRVAPDNNQIYLLRDFQNNPSGSSLDSLGSTSDEWQITQNQHSADQFVMEENGSYTLLRITTTGIELSKYASDGTLVLQDVSTSIGPFNIDTNIPLGFEKDNTQNYYISIFDLSTDRPVVIKYDGTNFSTLGAYVIDEPLTISELKLHIDGSPSVLLTRSNAGLADFDHMILNYDGTSWNTEYNVNITSSQGSFSSFDISKNDSLYFTYSSDGGFNAFAQVCLISNGDSTVIGNNIYLSGDALVNLKILVDKTEKIHILSSGYSLGWIGISHYLVNNGIWSEIGSVLPLAHDIRTTSIPFSLALDSLNTLYLGYTYINDPFLLDPDTNYFVRRLGNCDFLASTNIISENATNEFFTSFSNAESYQWINCLDNNEIVNETDTVYTPIVTGDYAVVIEKHGCIDTSNCLPYINDLGLEDINTPQIVIAPNPSANWINVNNPNNDNQSISIYNILGEEVYSSNSKFTNIPVYDLRPGSYIVILTTQSNNYKLSFIKH